MGILFGGGEGRLLQPPILFSGGGKFPTKPEDCLESNKEHGRDGCRDNKKNDSLICHAAILSLVLLPNINDEQGRLQIHLRGATSLKRQDRNKSCHRMTLPCHCCDDMMTTEMLSSLGMSDARLVSQTLAGSVIR